MPTSIDEGCGRPVNGAKSSICVIVGIIAGDPSAGGCGRAFRASRAHRSYMAVSWRGYNLFGYWGYDKEKNVKDVRY